MGAQVEVETSGGFEGELHDESGDYPSEELLEWIRTRPVETPPAQILTAMIRAWQWGEEWAREIDGMYVFATGGWSGNEQLITAWEHCPASWPVKWDSLYVPGGLSMYAIGTEAQLRLKSMFGLITKWAWSGGA